MKKLVAFLLTVFLVFGIINTVSNGELATPTDLEPTPKPITVTKVLKGEIWQVRCDVMDNTTFTAGGGRWMADITNSANITSKEGHRSNHCGNKENWVLFVNEEGKANEKVFTCIVKIDGIVLGTGTSTSKKEAEQEAAKDALSKMNK